MDSIIPPLNSYQALIVPHLHFITHAAVKLTEKVWPHHEAEGSDSLAFYNHNHSHKDGNIIIVHIIHEA